MHTSPSCACCNCTISDFNRPVEECSGDWELISGPRYRTIQGDSLLRSMKVGNPAQPWHVTAQFNLVSAAGSSYQMRVIGGLVDCANYLYFELSPTAVRLVSVVGNVHSEITRSPKGNGCPSGGVTFNLNEILNISWDGLRLLGWLGEDLIFPLGSTELTPTGGGSGVAIGNLVGNDPLAHDPVTVSNFRHAYAQSADRPTCLSLPSHCCLGDVPPAVVLEVSGILTGEATVPSSTIPGGVCRVLCEEILGTVFLSRPPFTPAYPDCYDQVLCEWDFARTLGMTINCSVPDEFHPPELRLGAVYYHAEILGSGSDTRTINVEVILEVDDGVGGFGGIAELIRIVGSAETDLPCEEWAAWIPLTIEVQPPGCSNPSLTLRIKKA